jgi:hypothetical protein
MPEFSKETLKFISEIGPRKKFLQPDVPSADRITPGNIMIFRYDVQNPSYQGAGGRFTSNQKVVLIIRCKRGDGVFEGKDGKLVSCFKLDAESGTVVDAIVENLYKKRRRASYYGKIKKSLVKLLGIDSFRTYKLTEMTSIYRVII